MHLIDLIKKNNIIQIIICLGIAISTAFLSVYLMIGKVTKTFAILSFTLTAVISFVYLLINRKKICKNIIKNKKSTKDIIV